MSPLEIALIVLAVPLGLAVLAFWVWMLIDCLRYEGPASTDRILWLLVIVLLKLIGAALYYFMRYRGRHELAPSV